MNLCRNDEEITLKETKCAGGTCPVWNQPFVFDIPEGQVRRLLLTVD